MVDCWAARMVLPWAASTDAHSAVRKGDRWAGPTEQQRVEHLDDHSAGLTATLMADSKV